MKTNSRKTGISDPASNLGNHVAQVGNRVSEFVADNTEAARERLAKAYVGARKTVAAKVKSSRVIIRSHPFESVLTAIGIGLAFGALAGVLLGRRCS